MGPYQVQALFQTKDGSVYSKPYRLRLSRQPWFHGETKDQQNSIPQRIKHTAAITGAFLHVVGIGRLAGLNCRCWWSPKKNSSIPHGACRGSTSLLRQQAP
jgi:hypothetical protein